MSGGVALFDYDNDGLLDIYFVDSLTVETAERSRRRRAARSTAISAAGGSRTSPTRRASAILAGAWACARPTWTATAGRTSTSPRSAATISTATTTTARSPTSREQAGVARRRLVRRLRLRRLRSRRPPRPLRQPLREDRPRATCPSSARTRPASTAASPVQCGPRGLPGEGDLLFHNDGNGRFTDVSARRPACPTRAATSASASPGSTSTTTAGRTSTSPTTRRRTSSTSTRRTARSRSRRSRWAWRSARTAPSRAAWASRSATTTTAAGSASSSPTSPRSTTRSTATTATTSPTSRSARRTAAGEPALRRLGHGVLRLRQRRLARSHRRQRPRLPAARPGAPRRVAPAIASGKLLYHNRGDGTFDEVAAQYGPVLTEERVSRGLAVGDLDNDGRLDVVINDLDGAPQVLRNELAPRGPLADRQAARARRRTPTRSAPSSPSRPGGVTPAARRAERHELPLAGRHAPALRPGRGLEADAIEVRWPDGTTTRQAQVKANQVVTIRQRP